MLVEKYELPVEEVRAARVGILTIVHTDRVGFVSRAWLVSSLVLCVPVVSFPMWSTQHAGCGWASSQHVAGPYARMECNCEASMLMAMSGHSGFATTQARALSKFLRPMLDFVPEKRATAAEMLRHEWLAGAADASSGAGCANVSSQSWWRQGCRHCFRYWAKVYVMFRVKVC